jgi:hypothetical protein
MRALAVLALTLVLSGCFGSGPSQKEMEADLAEAIGDFRGAVLPGGDLTRIQVSGQVAVHTDSAFGPITVRLEPEIDVQMGIDSDVLITGNALRLDFTAYCSPDRLIAITSGGAEYDVPDGSNEVRNTIGHCTGAGSEQILLAYFDFQLIDPNLLTGELDLDAMIPVTFEDNGKKGSAGVYEIQGPEGTTTLTISQKGGQIKQIVSTNDDSNLVLDMAYGERVAITPPSAKHRLPTPVSGRVETNTQGWTWTGTGVTGGPLQDYRVDVYASTASLNCGGANVEPTVSFSLTDGYDQSQNGWQFFVLDNGDAALGRDDQLLVRSPGGTNFDHLVQIQDAWADQQASFSCATPGPGIGLGISVLAAAVFLARRA